MCPTRPSIWTGNPHINKTMKKIRAYQYAMELPMLELSLRDRVSNTEIRRRTRVEALVHKITTLKCNWVGQITRMTDGRWT